LENENLMRLTVDLPGVLAKDLDVSVEHGILSISGSRKTFSIDGSVCVKKQKISRRYAIDTDVVDIEKVEANLACGVLTIEAPKKSKPHRVKIQVKETAEEEEAKEEETSRHVHISTTRNPKPVLQSPAIPETSKNYIPEEPVEPRQYDLTKSSDSDNSV
jgi:hypothetical protein